MEVEDVVVELLRMPGSVVRNSMVAEVLKDAVAKVLDSMILKAAVVQVLVQMVVEDAEAVAVEVYLE